MKHSVSELMFMLIRCSVCGEELSSAAAEELTPAVLTEMYAASKPQDVTHILADTLLSKNLIPDGELKSLYLKEQMTAVFRYAQIKHELSKIYSALDDAKIKHMPLKGSVIRSYYPKPHLRTSCDIDIFVDESDIDSVDEIFTEKLSYRFDVRTTHDVAYYSESKTHVELHFDLIEKDERVRKMLSRVWEESVFDGNSKYRMLMNNEMFVAYHVAHMAKHFFSGGCGIRPFLDLWIAENKMGYDGEKTARLLESCELGVFYSQVVQLSRIWFSDGEHTELTKEMEDYILGATIYGNTENRVAISQARSGGKIKYVLGRIFLPYAKLKIIYPTLEKYPILLPFYEIKRWFRLVFRKKTSIAIHELKVSGSMSDEKKKRVSELFDNLGLT